MEVFIGHFCDDVDENGGCDARVLGQGFCDLGEGFFDGLRVAGGVLPLKN